MAEVRPWVDRAMPQERRRHVSSRRGRRTGSVTGSSTDEAIHALPTGPFEAPARSPRFVKDGYLKSLEYVSHTTGQPLDWPDVGALQPAYSSAHAPVGPTRGSQALVARKPCWLCWVAVRTACPARHLRQAGSSVLLTTHSMEEAQAVCDRVAILDRARTVVLNFAIPLLILFIGGGGRPRSCLFSLIRQVGTV